MTPKEKAIELILKFEFKGAQHEGEAKNFALIAVDEILKAVESDWGFMQVRKEYWQEVKQEINKLWIRK